MLSSLYGIFAFDILSTYINMVSYGTSWGDAKTLVHSLYLKENGQKFEVNVDLLNKQLKHKQFAATSANRAEETQNMYLWWHLAHKH